MRKLMKKAALIFALAGVLTLAFCLGAGAAEVVKSGECGDNLTYVLDSEGTLTISGTGEMWNWGGDKRSPWRSSIEVSDVNGTQGIRSTIPNLKNVVIENGVTTIGDCAFYECHRIISVTIPDSITSIGDCAFFLCSDLESINVAENNPAYSSVDGVLFNKDKTELIKFPCKNQKIEYEIPESVTAIDEYAFYDCRSLIGVTIPSSVTTIGESAFYACGSLISVTIPDSVTTIGEGAFVDCDSLTSISIPNSVTTIGEYAFMWCDSLTSVSIGSGVTTIGEDAFYDCGSLISVTIPDSVTTIDEDAFSSCDSLTDIYYSGTEEQWNEIEIASDNEPLTSAKIHFNNGTQPDSITVLVNGVAIDFDVAPIIIEGTTMLPVRKALEPLGAEFIWDEEAQTVAINANGKNIVITIGDYSAKVDGDYKDLLKPAMIIDGRTLIPIRFVAEELGYNVGWDGDTKTVSITQ